MNELCGDFSWAINEPTRPFNIAHPSRANLNLLSLPPFTSGEYIKNWRPRWFVLMANGAFLGYKNKPQQGSEPLNNFKIQSETHDMI